MTAIPVEQAIYRRAAGAAPALTGRSPGFVDDWLPEAERMVLGFGERPPGVACRSAVFARPLGKRHVAVVQVADGAGTNPPLKFRFLVLPRADYENYLGDPFAVADRFPASWEGGDLAALSLPAEPLPPRTVEQVREVLKRVKAHALPEDQDPEAYDDWRDIDPELAQSPALLGGVQVLVDGGKLVFERPGPDGHLMRGLWTLLPTSTRAQLWPATFAFGNALGFDALVVPKATGGQYEGYTNEDQAAEYPQGGYELNLQIAAEAGDQAALDGLLARRSWRQTWRLGLVLLAVMLVLVAVSNWRTPPEPPAPPPPVARPPRPADWMERVGVASGMVSCGDPWTAMNLFHIGTTKWSKK